MMQPVFACDVSALSPEERRDHLHASRILFRSIESVSELPNGYVFIFAVDPALLRASAEFLALERLCCPFFDLTLEIPAGSSTFRLSITGAEGIHAFIRAEFGPRLPPGLSL